jgi:hypothetical protein
MTAILATLFNSIALIILGILGTWSLSARPRKWHRKTRKVLWFTLIVSVVLSLAFQVSSSYHEQTYKNDLILRYQDRYEEKLTGDRAQAAKAISDYLHNGNWKSVTNQYNIDGLENVLAFYDELGFYWRHGEISSDVLYEHFYYEMRIYCQPTMGYIRDNQKTDSVADWEYVEPLFSELTRIEASKTGKSIKDCTWDAKTLTENLDSEIRRLKEN